MINVNVSAGLSPFCVRSIASLLSDYQSDGFEGIRHHVDSTFGRLLRRDPRVMYAVIDSLALLFECAGFDERSSYDEAIQIVRWLLPI